MAYRLECAQHDRDGTSVVYTTEESSSRSVRQWQTPLKSTTRYQWRVQTKSEALWGDWSSWATFETALFDESDWCGAGWIGSAIPGPAPILSTAFMAHRGSHLRLYLCGLGVANARLNGEPVGEGVTDPPPSAYDATVFYRVFDVSDRVNNGDNTLAVLLGRGYYAMATPTAFNWHIAPWRAEPKLRALLVDLDHPAHPLLRTNETWLTTQSSVVDDSLYAGETRDFGQTGSLHAAVVATPPRGQLISCQQSAVTRRERIEVVGHHWTGHIRQRFDLVLQSRLWGVSTGPVVVSFRGLLVSASPA